MNRITVHFLGGAGTVTGSKFLLETEEINLMIDCGMFQGLKSLRELNWQDLAFDPSKINVVLLTHGHLDHTGYLPRLVKQGFSGRIIATAPTQAITKIILKDSAKINEEQAEEANREGYSKHEPAEAFYTIEDVQTTLNYFEAAPRDQWQELSEHVRFQFRYNGHILGATFVELDIYGKRFVFSGDVGRPEDSLLNSPEKPEWADYLFLESTYGNKLHPNEDPSDVLVELVRENLLQQGTLIIPSFAVERLQVLMFLLWTLYRQNRIPNVPIFVDSPMGNNVLDVFAQFPEWHKLSPTDFGNMERHVEIIESYRETWETIDDPRSKIVIAGSGMVTGGRVLTYLQQLIDIATTTILLVGFQAEGTRGRDLLDGCHELKFKGKYYPVKAHVRHIQSLSAHADQAEILDWLSEIKNIPERVFLIHGEPSAAQGLRVKLKDRFNWDVSVPKLGETVEIITV